MKKAVFSYPQSLLCVFLCAVFLVCASSVHAASTAKKPTAPIVNLKVWSESTEQERLAFLAGFINLLELEKEWQGQKGLLPLRQSTVGSWVHGLDGITLTAMRDTVDGYITRNPDKTDKLVLEVLWYELVQPKVKETIPADEKKTTKRLRSTMKEQRQ